MGRVEKSGQQFVPIQPRGFLLSGNKSINIRCMCLHLDPGSHVPRDLRKSMEQENGLALGPELQAPRQQIF